MYIYIYIYILIIYYTYYLLHIISFFSPTLRIQVELVVFLGLSLFPLKKKQHFCPSIRIPGNESGTDPSSERPPVVFEDQLDLDVRSRSRVASPLSSEMVADAFFVTWCLVLPGQQVGTLISINLKPLKTAISHPVAYKMVHHVFQVGDFVSRIRKWCGGENVVIGIFCWLRGSEKKGFWHELNGHTKTQNT